MADDKPLRSAYEAAMERLRKSDEASGVQHRPLTNAQKAAIAETRSIYEAKLAQEDVMLQSRLAASLDPAAREALTQQFRRDRERLTTERDSKIEKIRNEPS